MAKPSLAEQVAARLEPFLGAFNAKIWIKTVADKKLGRAPEALGIADLSALLDGLRPALSTFIGRSAADELLERIRREVR